MKSIILIGMPGSGKTTVCSFCSKKYCLPIYDTDEYIEKRYGKISDIFRDKGEQYFRQLETQALKNVCALGGVISTGGGCAMRDENIQIMKSSGEVVYLKASLSTLEQRLRGDTSRPLLQGGRQKLEALFFERRQRYENVCDSIIEVDYLTPEEIAERVYNLIIKD